MRTVGEILKKARLEKKLIIEDVEKQLRIRKKYLIALEENSWDKLPALPYIKGFLRNYSCLLGLKPEEMLAVFRRQFQNQDKTRLLPKGLSYPLNSPIIRFTPQITIGAIIISFLILFFSYLAFQYKTYISPPNLTIDKPAEGEIVNADRIQIIGRTDPDAVVSVNNQKIALSADGTFTTLISISPGVNTIAIESVSKYGKKKTVSRIIQYQQVNEF
ncbi:helix-turn-helix domain-containing protein [Candidatus Gottesmanbacteria bacterium]|nr:helix-turn-helix domain-containing protein [Candidatus Gottesmanbacteria bacterium]